MKPPDDPIRRMEMMTPYFLGRAVECAMASTETVRQYAARHKLDSRDEWVQAMHAAEVAEAEIALTGRLKKRPQIKADLPAPLVEILWR